MKKVFLSLAALSFVAASSLTVVSCGGSDDAKGPNNPNPNNPGNPSNPSNPNNPNPGTGDNPPAAANNTFVVNGTTYAVDANTFLIQSTGDQNGDGKPDGVALGKYKYTENGPEYVVSEWVGIAYKQSTDGTNNSPHELQVFFDVEAAKQDNGSYKLQLPNQTENIFVWNIKAVVNGENITGEAQSYGIADVDFNVFDLQTSSLTVNYLGTESAKKLSFNYNGESEIKLMQWHQPQQGAKGAVKSKATFKPVMNTAAISNALK